MKEKKDYRIGPSPKDLVKYQRAIVWKSVQKPGELMRLVPVTMVRGVVR